jgi:hypothetical protein
MKKISDQALLLTLSISRPPMTRKARRASDKAESEYRTAKRQAAVVKTLYSKKDIKPLQTAAGAVRRYVEKNTLPYRAGVWILPSAKYLKFVEGLQPLMENFEATKQRFIDEYHLVKSRAMLDLGNLYNGDDYPSAEELAAKVSVNLDMELMPDDNDFDRLSGAFDDEVIDDLKARSVESKERRLESAMESLAQRLVKSVRHAITRLSDEDAVFRDSLLKNIHGAIEDIRDLNLTGDQELEELASEIQEVIHGLEPKDLRVDKETRREVVEELTQKMGEFF